MARLVLLKAVTLKEWEVYNYHFKQVVNDLLPQNMNIGGI